MADDPSSDDATPRRPAVLLHGFGQDHRCLGPLADTLAHDRPVVRPDVAGHGPDPSGDRLDCPAAAADLVGRTIPDRGGPRSPAHWFGYSMGGRLALHVALRHTEAVGSLVLLGATAGIEDPTARAQRRDLDERRAAHLEEVGVAAFIEEWLEAPMFAGLPEWARFTRYRGENRVEGLAGSLRHAGTGAMAPLWDDLGRIEVPVLCLAGGRDERFAATAARMAEAIGPNATVSLVPGAGHAAHLEQPAATAELVASFLDDADRLPPHSGSRPPAVG